jgi:hypothetical protein
MYAVRSVSFADADYDALTAVLNARSGAAPSCAMLALQAVSVIRAGPIGNDTYAQPPVIYVKFN